jgi:hypothetical protein
VAERYAELSKLQISDEDRERLEQIAETEFLRSTATLAGAFASPAAELSASLRLVKELVRNEGRQAALTTELLIELNNLLGDGRGFRKGAITTTGPFRPTAAEHIEAAIQSICRWSTAESFVELNPLEQASITHLRLLEIQPFERANLETALVAASLFTLRVGMPPIIIKRDDSDLYRAAVKEGAQTNTRPMVELMAAAMENTLNRLIEAARTGK